MKLMLLTTQSLQPVQENSSGICTFQLSAYGVIVLVLMSMLDYDISQSVSVRYKVTLGSGSNCKDR